MTAPATLPALSSSEPPLPETLSQLRPKTCSRMPDSNSASRVSGEENCLVEDGNRRCSSSQPKIHVDPKLGRLRVIWNSPKDIETA